MAATQNLTNGGAIFDWHYHAPHYDLDDQGGGGGGRGSLLLDLATGVISLPDTIIVYFYIVTVIVMAKYIS